jgi:putative addiction module killer protein
MNRKAISVKEWKLQYWDNQKEKSSIEQWFDKLTSDQFKSIAKELEMLRKVGNNLRMPHSKALGDGLFESRERRYGYRIYYAFHDNLLVILLAAGDKKSQTRDIRIARLRLYELLEDEK